jgi:hypothetical protein
MRMILNFSYHSLMLTLLQYCSAWTSSNVYIWMSSNFFLWIPVRLSFFSLLFLNNPQNLAILYARWMWPAAQNADHQHGPSRGHDLWMVPPGLTWLCCFILLSFRYHSSSCHSASTPFRIAVIDVYPISYNFVSHFLHLTVFMEHACLFAYHSSTFHGPES